MAINVIEQTITPVLPRVIDKEQINVYIPAAGYTSAGIASFNPRDFIVKDGVVRLFSGYSDLILASKPLIEPSFVKLLSSEFETVSPPNPEYPYAEVKLKRDWASNNVFDKRSLIQLNSRDFEQNIDNKIQIKWPTNPFTAASIVKLDSEYFRSVNGVIQYAQFIASNSRLGNVKIFDADNFLSVSQDGLLKFNSEKYNSDMEMLNKNIEYSYIQPEFRDIDIGSVNWYDQVTELDPTDSTKYILKRDAASPIKSRTRLEISRRLIGLRSGVDYDKVEFIGSSNSWDSSTKIIPTLVDTIGDLNNFKNSVTSQFNNTSNSFSAVNSQLTGLQTDISNLRLKMLYLGFKSSGNNGQSLNGGGEWLYKDPETGDDYINDTYYYNLDTSTFWYLKIEGSTKTWQDSLSGEFSLDAATPISSEVPKALGTASIGSGVGANGSIVFSFWDHVHPVDTNKITPFKLTIISNESDSNSVELSNNMPDTSINVPWVHESKFLHNYIGEYENGVQQSYVPGTAGSGKLVKLWIGTSEEKHAAFPINVPDDVLCMIVNEAGTYQEGLVSQDEFNTFSSAMYKHVDDELSDNIISNLDSSAQCTAVKITTSVNGKDITKITWSPLPNYLLSLPANAVTHGNETTKDERLGINCRNLISGNVLDSIRVGYDGSPYLTVKDLVNTHDDSTMPPYVSNPFINALIDEQYKIGDRTITAAITDLQSVVSDFNDTVNDLADNVSNSANFTNNFVELGNIIDGKSYTFVGNSNNKLELEEFNTATLIHVNSAIEYSHNQAGNQSKTLSAALEDASTIYYKLLQQSSPPSSDLQNETVPISGLQIMVVNEMPATVNMLPNTLYFEY